MSTLKRAVKLAHEGQSDRASKILRDLVNTNPNDVYAWLWLAETTANREEALQAARRVLVLHPTNQQAQTLLIEMGESPKLKRGESRKSMGNYALGASGLLILLLIVGIFFFLDESEVSSTIEASNQQTSKDERPSSSSDSIYAYIGGKLLESGLEFATGQVYISLIFDLLGLVDETADFNVDDRVSVTVMGQTIESPEYNLIVEKLYDSGNWVINKLNDLVR